MGRLSYVCAICSEHFTRKSSGDRHNLNLHDGQAEIVPLMHYLIGISWGKYQPSHLSQFRRSPSRWQKLSTTKNQSFGAVRADSTQGIIEPRYNLNLKQPDRTYHSKIIDNYTSYDNFLEDASFRQQQPFSGYTQAHHDSEDYMTLQNRFRCNLHFPNTMQELLELETLLFKLSDYQVVNPSMILQNAIDQCANGDHRFLADKLKQLRYMNALKQ